MSDIFHSFSQPSLHWPASPSATNHHASFSNSPHLFLGMKSSRISSKECPSTSNLHSTARPQQHSPTIPPPSPPTTSFHHLLLRHGKCQQRSVGKHCAGFQLYARPLTFIHSFIHPSIHPSIHSKAQTKTKPNTLAAERGRGKLTVVAVAS